MDDDNTKLAEMGGSLHGPILYREWNCYPRWREAPWELIVKDIRGTIINRQLGSGLWYVNDALNIHKAAVSCLSCKPDPAFWLAVDHVTPFVPFQISKHVWWRSWNSSENSIVSNLTPQWFWLKSCIKSYPIYDFKLFFILLLYELSLQSEKLKNCLKKGALKTMPAITTRLHTRRYQKKPR